MLAGVNFAGFNFAGFNFAGFNFAGANFAEDEGPMVNLARLRIYLADHLAMMVGELALAGRCRCSNRGTELDQLLQRWEQDVRLQQSTLKTVLQRLGGRPSLAKGTAAWMAEKLGRLKLNASVVTYSDLSRLIELEALQAAAGARLTLWENLNCIEGADQRLKGISYLFFRDQTQEHLSALDGQRKSAAIRAFWVT